jgi:hypothetical protein
VLNGTGAPDNTVGHDGDFYLDTAAEVLYGPKAGGAWPTPGTSLTGQPGPQGPAGPAGPAGSAGSLDSLAGTPCENGTGTLKVTYAFQADGNNPATIICQQNSPELIITIDHGGNLFPGEGTVTSALGNIDCSGSGGTCSANFQAGTHVILTATPDAGSSFVSWSGCDSTSGQECFVTMNTGHFVTAQFMFNG